MTVGRLPAVEGGIQPTIIDAKGDLIAGVSNDTPGRLPVGADGAVLQADSSASTGVSWAGPLFVAGKNKIINGNFGVWQRGLTFTSPADNTYTSDRFLTFQNGTGATRTISAQTFTTGTAPVSGYEGTYFFRYLCSALGTGNTYQAIQQRVEDVRQLAGQTATFSFWAKADAAKTITLNINQNFGTGGSSIVNVDVTSTFAVTTSWQRFTKTVTIPSISGKTIGTGSFLQVGFELGSQTLTLDIWGWQLEAGSTATAFQTATGTIQGELAACQRYFQTITGDNAFPLLQGYGGTGGVNVANFTFPVTMRIAPTATKTGTWTTNNCSQVSAGNLNPYGFALSTTITVVGSYFQYPNNNTNNITFNAEL